jgi:hypothetical protein
MNSGIAKQIRERWPEVYKEYRAYYNYCQRSGLSMLGHNSYKSVDDREKQVINMAAQDRFGYDGRRYTSYDAFYDCLVEISRAVSFGSKIGFPKNIGCCRGGANWKIISAMIEEILGKDFEVYIYDYRV